jgi:hypothetical protein
LLIIIGRDPAAEVGIEDPALSENLHWFHCRMPDTVEFESQTDYATQTAGLTLNPSALRENFRVAPNVVPEGLGPNWLSNNQAVIA